ncbi:hypothetical protein LIER_13760 [Lithospermum erythrorhizon]|uniref:Uncharacterized protein n=1 Tax=Lithospermum erythrorhizon TaxID=34254 RepID=A0AAV3PY53_LITER
MKIHDPFEAGPSNWNDEEDDAYWSSSDSMEENLNEPGEETDIMDIELAPSGGDLNLRNQLDCLLSHEEDSWKQRAKTKAITDGDKNSKFFHAHVQHKSKTNNILDLTNNNKILLTFEANLKEHCRNHFQNLFNSSRHNNSNLNSFTSLANMFTHILSHQINKLNLPFTPEEVRTVLFQMPQNKSPGPDEHYWRLSD